MEEARRIRAAILRTIVEEGRIGFVHRFFEYKEGDPTSVRQWAFCPYCGRKVHLLTLEMYDTPAILCGGCRKVFVASFSPKAARDAMYEALQRKGLWVRNSASTLRPDHSTG